MLRPHAARCQGDRPWHVGRGGAIWSGGDAGRFHRV